MPFPQENRGGGAAAVVAEALSLDFAPANEAVSDYGAGKTMVGGMFAGRVVNNSGISAITDNGTAWTATVAAGAGEATNQSSSWSCPWFDLATGLIGDWSFIFRVETDHGRAGAAVSLYSPQVTGANNALANNLGLVEWSSAASWLRHNAYAKGTLVYGWNKPTSSPLNTAHWLRLDCIAGELTAYEGGSGATASWSAADTSGYSLAGSTYNCRLVLGNTDGSPHNVSIHAASLTALQPVA